MTSTSTRVTRICSRRHLARGGLTVRRLTADADGLQGSISSRHIVVVRPSYPVDGLPATVQILSLAAAAARDPLAAELHAYPGPLVKGNGLAEGRLPQSLAPRRSPNTVPRPQA